MQAALQIQSDETVREINLWSQLREHRDREQLKVSLKASSYQCKHCRQPVRTRLGNKNRWHFSHIPPVDCRFLDEKGPESELHLQVKRMMANNLLKKYPEGKPQIVFEEPIAGGKRIADVLLRNESGFEVAAEVQISPITLEKVQERTRDYQIAGVRVLWVFVKPNRQNSFQQDCVDWLKEQQVPVAWIELEYDVETEEGEE